MKKLFKIISLFILLLANFSFVFADELDINTTDPRASSTRGNYLDKFKQDEHFIGDFVGEKWIQWLTINVAKDIKNVFMAVAVVILFVVTIKLFFWGGGDEDLKKWRLSILWTTIGIIIMQISYVAFTALYDKWVNEATAAGFSDSVMYPITNLMEVMASFMFIGIAIFAFFRIVTGGWNEEKYKKWVQSITWAIIWFILIKISSKLVKSIYWDVNCTKTGFITTCNWQALGNPDLSETVKIIRSVIQYSTWFVWVIVIVLIIYAWMMIVTSAWSDEKIKKAKNMFKYIIIWMIIIVLSVSMFQFMWWADLGWVIGSFTK